MQKLKTTFSFIHISDLHFASKDNRINFLDKMLDMSFAPISTESMQNFKKNSLFYPSTYDQQVLLKSINFIKKIEHDFVLITGDISSTGMEEDLKKAYNIIDNEKLVIIKNIFFTSMTELGKIILLPGNHDRYSNKAKPFRESSYSPGGTLFDNIFSKYWKNNTGRAKSKVQVSILNKDGIDIAFIRVDFSLEAMKKMRELRPIWNYAGQGKAYNYILHEIEEKVKLIKDKYGDIPLFLANHFHPIQTKKSLKLRNADKFIKILKKLNINYLFCGHTHTQEIRKTDNNIVINCAGSLCSIPGENSFIHHEIQIAKIKSNYLVKLKSHLYKKYANGTIKHYQTICS